MFVKVNKYKFTMFIISKQNFNKLKHDQENVILLGQHYF